MCECENDADYWKSRHEATFAALEITKRINDRYKAENARLLERIADLETMLEGYRDCLSAARIEIVQ